MLQFIGNILYIFINPVTIFLFFYFFWHVLKNHSNQLKKKQDDVRVNLRGDLFLWLASVLMTVVIMRPLGIYLITF